MIGPVSTAARVRLYPRSVISTIVDFIGVDLDRLMTANSRVWDVGFRITTPKHPLTQLNNRWRFRLVAEE